MSTRAQPSQLLVQAVIIARVSSKQTRQESPVRLDGSCCHALFLVISRLEGLQGSLQPLELIWGGSTEGLVGFGNRVRHA